MEPILTYSEITGRVYIVTKYKRLDGDVIDTREKFDVTDWVESYAKKRNAQTAEENAKLREQIHWLKKGDILHVLTDQELADQQKHEREVQASITALDDENAKLRELVRDMHADVVRLKDELTTFDHKPTQDECVVGMLVLGILGSINDRMRELGVEVQS